MHLIKVKLKKQHWSVLKTAQTAGGLPLSTLTKPPARFALSDTYLTARRVLSPRDDFNATAFGEPVDNRAREAPLPFTQVKSSKLS